MDALLEALMAVLIALLALVPFFLIAVVARRWIQRAPTDDKAKMRRNLVYVYIVAVIAIWANLEALTKTRLWRRLSKTCCIELVNKSGVEVKDLELALRASGDLESDKSHRELMAIDSRTRFKTRADEFKVERLSGVVGTNRFSFEGAAKKGERLVIAISRGGGVEARVE